MDEDRVNGVEKRHIIDRWYAGDRIPLLAEDYGLTIRDVCDVIGDHLLATAESPPAPF